MSSMIDGLPDEKFFPNASILEDLQPGDMIRSHSRVRWSDHEGAFIFLDASSLEINGNDAFYTVRMFTPDGLIKVIVTFETPICLIIRLRDCVEVRL